MREIKFVINCLNDKKFSRKMGENSEIYYFSGQDKVQDGGQDENMNEYDEVMVMLVDDII